MDDVDLSQLSVRALKVRRLNTLMGSVLVVPVLAWVQQLNRIRLIQQKLH